MPRPLTSEEILSDLGVSPSSASSSTSKGFPLRQYTLLSTRYFTIYLQSTKALSLASLPPSLPLPILVQEAIKVSSFRRLGKSTNKPALEAAIANVKEHYKDFYTNITWHKEAILRIAGAGGVIEPSRVLDRNFPLAAIEAYLNDLATFLIENNFSSPEEYLASVEAAKTPTSKALSLEELTQALNAL